MAKPDKDDGLSELDDFFEKGIEKIEALEKQAKKDAEKKPAKKVEVSEDDRMLYDLLGAYAGKRAAQAMDARMPRPTQPASVAPPAPPMQPPVQPPMQQAPGAQGMPRPVVGGPAGPVSAGPISPLSQMGNPNAPGYMTRNYGTAAGLSQIEAARALDNTKKAGGVHDLLGQRRDAMNKIQSMGGGFVENPNYSGLMTPDRGVGKGPKASFVQGSGGMTQLPPSQPVSAAPPAAQIAPAPTAPPAPPKPGALSAALAGGKAILGSPAVSGALGGLGMAESGQEFMKRQAAGDIPGQIMAGAGVVGGAASMAPHPLAKVLGGALSAASPLSLYLYDKIKNSQPPLPKPRVPAPGTNLSPVEAYRQ